MDIRLKTALDGNSKVASLVTEIRENVRLPWVRTAMMLRFVQKNAKWPFEGANSYTEWLALNAGSLGAGLTMLRIYGWMAEYYEKDLRPKLQMWGFHAPPFEDLPEYVGPEILADLRKISRAGVTDIEKKYAERVMQGTVRRAEIREAWGACRKMVKVDPHRRGRIPTGKCKSGAGMAGKVFEAELLSALLMHKGIFSKTGEFIECKVIQNTNRLIPGVQLPDFIVACKEGAKELSLQAIEARFSIGELAHDFAKRFESYFDKVWLAVPKATTDATDAVRQLEKFNRVLVVDNGKVTIWQESETIETAGGNVGLLTSLLLAKEYW